MKQAFIVVGMQLGDEGKGSIVNALTQKYHNTSLIVRFNGGAQAGHGVTTPNGLHHIFSQFGSGTLIGTKTYLSEYVIIDPIALKNEAIALIGKNIYNPFNKIFINKNCPVVTPYHRFLNQAKELIRNNNRHGSCGMGIGECKQDFIENKTIVAADLKNPRIFKDLLKLNTINQIIKLNKFIDSYPTNINLPPEIDKFVQYFLSQDVFDFIYNDYLFLGNKFQLVDHEYLEKQYKKNETIIFEGAQGVLLDEEYGFHPYNSFSNCTFNNANQLLSTFDGPITKLGLIRCYQTRHGAGPLVTENKNLALLAQNDHNQTNQWQGNFRIGWLDFIMLDYALKITNKEINFLVVNHLDQIKHLSEIKYCLYYNNPLVNQLHPVATNPKYTVTTEQLAITKSLMDQRPEYITCKPNQLCEIIESLTKLKIGIKGYGPTVTDKQINL